MVNKVKKIAVMTSGGDAPGMNAAVRAVIRTALNNDIEVKGITRGYEGLLHGEIKDMTSSHVSEVIFRGGTFLLTARSKEMMTPEGQERAGQICKSLGIDALIIIGGDGSLAGGLKLSKMGINVIGIPGTIDLDLDCSDYTIGFDTAVNTAMEAISKIKDTSSSHERCSIVEVMGRDAGDIALWCAITGGAEEVLIPESGESDVNSIINIILENRTKGKKHNLIVVAEGRGGSIEMAQEIEKITGIQTRATILGHLQRGGSPTALDRMHASVMGYKAIEAILNGEENRIVVYRDGKHITVDLEEGLNYKREYDPQMYNIIKAISI
jgi:6-phosphofructokinase 1